MSALNVSLLQSELTWHDAAANRQRFDALLETLDSPTDLIVLPEMFASGFTQEPAAVAETMDGPTVQWMLAKAQALDAALCGSLVIADRGEYVNRLLLALPDGSIKHYDKRHLFTLAGEDRCFRAGEARPIFRWRGWRVLPQVCYDLRFPVFSRNRGDYDAIVYVANWPKARHFAWETLLRARAIENQACVIAVNRVGADANGLEYQGGSALIDDLGGTLVDAGTGSGVFRGVLDRAVVEANRERLAFLNDADPFSLSS